MSETDGPHRIHPSILKVLANTQASGVNLPHSTRQSFKSLDRSLKAFLRASNLPGLEYRLRIAGYNVLSDLLDADVDTLCAHGFTPLMAHRLLGALDEYLVRHLDQSEGLPVPFEMVRKGQKINSAPTEKMKALPTFGKRNVKRQRQPELPKMAKRRVGPSKGAKVIGQNRPVSYLRLMSEESLPHEPIFPNVLPQDPGEEGEEEEEVWASNGDEDTAAVFLPSPGGNEGTPDTSGESGVHQGLPVREARVTSDPAPPGLEGRGIASTYRHSVPVFQEFSFPDEVDIGQAWLSSEELGRRLNRRNSIPADYRFRGNYVAAVQPWQLLTRSYSSPSSLADPPSQIESTLNKLCTSQELVVIESSLEHLCFSARSSEEARGEVREKGGLDIVVDLLASLCTNPRVVERCFKIIKYLSRDAALEGVVPTEVVTAILQAMDCHPTSGKMLTQGCLALGNVARAAPSLSEPLLSSHALATLTLLMETFPSSSNLQVSVMSALAVGLGCWPEGRLHLLTEHGKLLDLVVTAMRCFPESSQVQEYGCSFIALLMTEVAVEMESGVVQLMVEHVCIAMVTQGQSAEVIEWAAKALAHAAPNAALSDSKLAGRGCDLLVGALSAHPAQSQVWTWGLYALLQLTSRNSSVKGDLVRSGVISLLKIPPCDVPQHGLQYLEQLLTILVSP